MDSNTKDRIKELRRKRAAAKGKADRASAAAQTLRIRAGNMWGEYSRLGQEIEAMGGKIRR